MIGYVRQLTPFELASFRRNPKQLQDLLDEETLDSFPADVGDAVARMQELLNRGMHDSPEVRRLESVINEGMRRPSAQEHLITNRARLDQKRLDLGKSWHLLHYLLTGSAKEASPPLGNAILGGRPIGPDMGYGPARFLTPQEVREVAIALWEITADQLASRFDLAAIVRAGIYTYGGVPPSEDEDVDEINTEYLATYLSLGDYYNGAAESGNGMLLYIR